MTSFCLQFELPSIQSCNGPKPGLTEHLTQALWLRSSGFGLVTPVDGPVIPGETGKRKMERVRSAVAQLPILKSGYDSYWAREWPGTRTAGWALVVLGKTKDLDWREIFCKQDFLQCLPELGWEDGFLFSGKTLHCFTVSHEDIIEVLDPHAFDLATEAGRFAGKMFLRGDPVAEATCQMLSQPT